MSKTNKLTPPPTPFSVCLPMHARAHAFSLNLHRGQMWHCPSSPPDSAGLQILPGKNHAEKRTVSLNCSRQDVCSRKFALAHGNSFASSLVNVKLVHGSCVESLFCLFSLFHPTSLFFLLGEHLRICPQGYTCCTSEMEDNLATLSRREMEALLRNDGRSLQSALVGQHKAFDGEKMSEIFLEHIAACVF